MRGRKLAVLGTLVLLAVAAAGVLFVRKRPSRQVLTDDMLPIDMTWEQAEAYLQKSGYPVAQSHGECAPNCSSYRIGGTTLKGTKPFEEELIFDFARFGDSSLPVCVTYYPGIHGDGWQAGFDRVLGARPKIPSLASNSPACRPVASGDLVCRSEATSKNGRVVPVELDVRPSSKRVVFGLRFGSCPK
jgi:hypothetical protein